MARAHFVKAANKTIYRTGKVVKYISKKGKREGAELSKRDRTIPENEKDEVVIAKGESYWWWQFKNSSKTISRTRPKNSQLTQSNYLSQLYSIQETVEELSASDISDLESMIDEIKSELESLKEETEGSLENMPESLQYSPTGELLQERIDALDNAISEFESIDLDYDEPDEDELREELKDDVDDSKIDYPEEGDENFDDFDEDEEKKKLVTEEMIEERKAEKMQEFVDEKIGEIQDISFE